MKQHLRERVATVWRDPVWSKVIATVITAVGGATIVLIIATARGCFSPEPVVKAPDVQPSPGAASEVKGQPGPVSRAKPPGLGPPNPEAPKSAGSLTVPPPAPAVAFGPAPPAVDCQPYTPERPPNVTLQPGDLVVAGGGGVYRLDRDMKETRITTGEHVIDARGVAVAPDGHIYLSATACRKGAIVQVDPKTGTQTPLFFGFGTPMGIYTDGETILVGDENPRQSGPWGELWKISLKERTRASIHTFMRDAVATSIARDPQTGDLFFAVRRTVYRLDGKEGGALRPLDFEGLVNVHALAITPQGEMYVGEYDGGKIMLIQRGTLSALRTYPGFATLWNLRAATDGKSLFAAAGSGTSAKVHRVPLFENERSTEVWSARSDGFAVFLAVVERQDASSKQ